MKVDSPPERFVDQTDDNSIIEFEPSGSRFSAIAVKQLDDGIEVRAREIGTERVIEFQAELTEQLYRGVSIKGDVNRRDVEDDIQDALALVGYALVDDDVRAY